MKKSLQQNLFIFLGWFFVFLAAVGVLLPILPTTPFLVLALALFAKSSSRFHQMLLNNRYFGAILKQWEETKTVSRAIKTRATIVVLMSFSISIFLLQECLALQLMLVLIALILLVFLWRLKEF